MGLLATSLVLISGIAMAQTKADTPVPGVINIKFKQETLQVNRQDIYPEEIEIFELRALLSGHGFARGEKIFRHFEARDTLTTSRINGEPVILLDLSRWYTIWVADTVNTLRFAEQLMELPGVEAASPEFLMYPQQVFPNDPRFQSNNQWGLYNWANPGKDIHAPQAWEMNTGRSDVIIAVIDGGVDYTHSDLDPGNRSRIIQGYDVADNDSNPMDDIPSQYGFANHGTAVAGIIGAITDNNQQVAGVMWDAKIMPVKVAHTSSPWWDPFGWSMGGAPHSKVAAGVDWARQNGANIINLSLGGQGVSGNWYSTFINNPVTQATYNAYLSGILVVAAMGNDGNQTVNYPAGFPWTIAVGASSQSDFKASFSNSGSHIDVVAPGVSYYSTYRNNQDGSFSGTSAAAPVVSGVAGLILSQSRDLGLNLTHDDIRNTIRVTADKVSGMGAHNFTNDYGYGRVNAYEALKLISPPNIVEHGTAYGGSSTLFWNNHTHTFYRGMGTLATGVYYGVRTYKITGFTSFSNYFDEPPVVWIRDQTTKGWSGANPNMQVPWVNITSVTKSGFYYETFVYWIGTNSAGQSINTYYPASPSNARIDYTAVGKLSGDVWSGNMNITSTYTVEATDLLTITPGSSITFTNNSDFIVNGELIANGVTFDFVTPSNNGIKFNSGSSGTISYSTIKNATTGIWATGSSTSINIHDNVISDNGTGVHLTSTGTNVLITDNVIEDNTIGMWLYQSNASVSGNIIENNTYGMNADYVSTTAEHDGNKVRYNTARGLFLNSSNLWVTTSVFAGNGGNQVLINDGRPSFAESPGFEGYNVIAYGAGPMLKAQNGAYVFMGYSADGGYNSFYETDMPHIRAENNSGVWADRNYWEGGPGNSMDGTSWVTSNNTLSTDPNPPYYQKMIAGNSTSNRYDDTDNHTRVPEELLTAMRVSMGGEIEQGLSVLKSYIENDRQSSFAPLALIGYNALVHRQMQGLASEGPRQTLQAELTAYLHSQSTTGQSDPLWPYAVRLLANNAMLESDYEIGRDHLLSLAEFSSYDSVHNLLAQYNLFTYYLEVEQNFEKATSYLSQLLRNHPDDELTQTAQVLAGIYLNSVPDPIAEQHGKEKQISDIVQVGAYPNPFNPNAVIRYSIPEDGQVRLAVFDVLGRQVSELVNGSVRAGVHEVAFNGANLASGIYVYRLQVSGQIITGKMMLLK